MSAASVPRLRMFAGPNGSGKSTIKLKVSEEIGEELFGYYINPDEIEAEIKESAFLNFSRFNLEIDAGEALDFFQQSEWLKEAGLAMEVAKLGFNENKLDFSEVKVNSYFASVAADFIRHKLLASQQTFTFETVMSARNKVDFLAKSQAAGYRTYLYYVATEDPEINISRVALRVSEGGHDVPPGKITARYYRSLELLWEAIKYTDRAYIFDNSTIAYLIAEVTDAEDFDPKVEDAPAWFSKYVLENIGK